MTRQRKPTAREEFRNRLERLECMCQRMRLVKVCDGSKLRLTRYAAQITEGHFLKLGSDTTLPTIHESGNHLPSCRLDERSTHESTLSLDQPNQGSIPSSGDNPLPSPRDSLQIDCWTFEGRAFPLQTPRISYPFLELAPALWHIYTDNVAPLLPLLHKPSTRNLLLLGTQSKQSMTQNKKALILSILFVAVVSMSPAKCGMVLKESRDSVVRYLKSEVKQALSDARFLTTTSLTCMQGLVLFLIGLYAENEQHDFWSMTALVLHRAKGMNVHRDGAHFGLTPLRAEMRRRLWWMICLLGVYSCEDHARETRINEEMYDVRLPLNVNDDDLFPGMQALPPERKGGTELTFCLLRFETISILHSASSTPGSSFNDIKEVSNDDRLCKVQKIRQYLDETYLKHCDQNIPIFWVGAAVTRLIMAKACLSAYHQILDLDNGTPQPPLIGEKLIQLAVEMLQLDYQLRDHPVIFQWGWHLRSCTQWHGMAVALSAQYLYPASSVSAGHASQLAMLERQDSLEYVQCCCS
ncbi:unnamed protein product [Aspergillus oryzae var. brunneus]|uniref:Unnamed protein product n=1 Tax=Aspergillus oryzae var. brunneus TaxID=332754 RepID=A0ABQ6L9H1_ASPOZ|nr:unnamed protein product [Aspergillus oryzae var. brunneus]